MAAKRKLTAEQLSNAQEVWESDLREGYTWLVKELELPVSAPAIRKAAIKAGWKKVVNEIPPIKMKVSKVSQAKELKVSETIVETLTETIDTEEKNDVGRPTLYKPEYAEQAFGMCFVGATDKQMAEVFGVDERTINNWKKEHPEFFQSISKGKLAANGRVGASLFQRAIGYSHKDVHISNFQGVITETPITKHYPPDVKAQQYILNNRMPENWKNNVEVKEEINLNVFPPKEELDAIYDKALADAKERDQMLVGRRERLGITIDHDAMDDD